MSSRLIAALCLLSSPVVARVAAAEVDATDKWVPLRVAKLGLEVRHPKNAKTAVRGAVVTISGPELPTVTITIATTTERETAKSGGASGGKVDWTIAVPKRSARCVAEAVDPEQQAAASWICDSIVLAPGAKSPHVEIANVTASGVASAAGYEKMIRSRGRALDACWRKALAKDPALPEGSLTLVRDYTDGHPSSKAEHAENFFDHDAKPLAACVFPLLESVAVKTTAPTAQVQVELICRLY